MKKLLLSFGFFMLIFLELVSATPYCVNGPVGDIEIEKIELDNNGNWAIVPTNVYQARIFVKTNGAAMIRGTMFFTLLNMNTNTNVSVQTIEGTSILPNVTMEYSVEFQGSEFVGQNEEDNYLMVVKAFEGGLNSASMFVSNETNNCDEETAPVDLQEYRSVIVQDFQLTPSFLGCDGRNFTATVTAENKGAQIDDVKIQVSDAMPGLLNLVQESSSFSLDENEIKTVRFDFALPGFHLYRHPFDASVESVNMNSGNCNYNRSCGGPLPLVIDKCPTDNAQDIRKEIPKIWEKIGQIWNCVFKNECHE